MGVVSVPVLGGHSYAHAKISAMPANQACIYTCNCVANFDEAQSQVQLVLIETWFNGH